LLPGCGPLLPAFALAGGPSSGRLPGKSNVYELLFSAGEVQLMRWACLAIFDLSFRPGRESQVGAHAVARREKGRMYP